MLLLPSKLTMGPGTPILPSTRCTTGSGTTLPTGPGITGPSSSFSRLVHSFAITCLMVRNGGEISNFATRMTPLYWARITGCGFRGRELDWAEALLKLKSTSVIAEKQSKTANKRRSLKNADRELDFFFMMERRGGWWFALKCPGAFQHNF